MKSKHAVDSLRKYHPYVALPERERHEDIDPLGPSRGVLLGALIGALMWLALALLLVVLAAGCARAEMIGTEDALIGTPAYDAGAIAGRALGPVGMEEQGGSPLMPPATPESQETLRQWQAEGVDVHIEPFGGFDAGALLDAAGVTPTYTPMGLCTLGAEVAASPFSGNAGRDCQ